MAEPKTLYEGDFVAWSMQQAEALRSAARTGSNQALDWENLAEEIESLGPSQRSAVASQVRRVARHLLKLQHSPAPGTPRGWIEMREPRSRICWRRAPVCGRDLTSRQVERAAKLATRDLEANGELHPAAAAALDATTYTRGQIIGDWLPGEPLPTEEGP